MTTRTYPDATALCLRLGALRTSGKRLGHDIEGYPGTGVTDFSFASSPTEALWVPLRRVDGSPWWSPDDEQRVMAATRAILEDPAVPKVCHNAGYELFAWQWAHGITMRGLAGDTMLLFHEAYAEIEKALEVVASLFTRGSYWKAGRDATTEAERAAYNTYDSMVTLEVEQAMLSGGHLTPGQLAHYEHRLALLEPTLYQMMTGFRFDQEARRELVAGLWRDIYALQGELDGSAGIAAPAFREVVEAVCNKRKWEACVDWPDVLAHANKSWREEMAI